MATAQDLEKMKKNAQEQVRQAEAQMRAQKDLLRKQIADYDRDIANSQDLRRKAQDDLNRL